MYIIASGHGLSNRCMREPLIALESSTRNLVSLKSAMYYCNTPIVSCLSVMPWSSGACYLHAVNTARSVSLPRNWDVMDVTMGSATY